MDNLWIIYGYWLVVTGTWLLCFHMLGMSSSHWTFICFRGVETTNQKGIILEIDELYITLWPLRSEQNLTPTPFRSCYMGHYYPAMAELSSFLYFFSYRSLLVNIHHY